LKFLRFFRTPHTFLIQTFQPVGFARDSEHIFFIETRTVHRACTRCDRRVKPNMAPLPINSPLISRPNSVSVVDSINAFSGVPMIPPITERPD